MGSFFPEPTSPVDGEDDDDREETPQPVWLNPPEGWLPGVVAIELLLARTDTLAVMLTGMRAFPDGVSMRLSVRSRRRFSRHDLGSEVFDWPYRDVKDDQWNRDRFKWGIELSNKARVTNLDPWPNADNWHARPDRPMLSAGGGQSTDRSVDRDYWLWPLPPAGPLTVVCQCLAYGLEQTSTTIDADLILDAATRAQPLWPS